MSENINEIELNGDTEMDIFSSFRWRKMMARREINYYNHKLKYDELPNETVEISVKLTDEQKELMSRLCSEETPSKAKLLEVLRMPEPSIFDKVYLIEKEEVMKNIYDQPDAPLKDAVIAGLGQSIFNHTLPTQVIEAEELISKLCDKFEDVPILRKMMVISEPCVEEDK